jgi:molybdopterin-binding protein
MNQIKASITAIESFEDINVVSFSVGTHSMKMMSLQLDNSLHVGSNVILTAKATHISLAKNLSGELSISNILHVRLIEVNNGEVLSSIKFDFEGVLFESIITKASSIAMNLKEDDEIIALIKSSELSVVEIL